MGYVYIGIDEVVDIHATVIELGGRDGVLSHHALAAAVMQPQQSAFGEDAYPTLAEKAAAYGFFLTQAHAFIDGNKRTAHVTMINFLDLNGYEMIEEEDAIAQMFEDVAAGVVEQGEFFGWVVNHAKPRREEKVVGLPPRE